MRNLREKLYTFIVLYKFKNFSFKLELKFYNGGDLL